MSEAIIDADLPIVDPHHHLWWQPGWTRAETDAVPSAFDRVAGLAPRYLLDELLVDLESGHNIIATMFVECGAMYRAAGPREMQSVGETEFVNGVAAMSDSGRFGTRRICAGIVGNVDLALGDRIAAVLERHLRASDRFRGIRQTAPHDPDAAVLGRLADKPADFYASASFRQGFARLTDYGLTFDAWLLEPQLPQLASLARAFPDQPIILDHVGTPLGYGSYAGRREERFPIWRRSIRLLAELPNVRVKLGGLGMPLCNFPSLLQEPPASSTQLAAEWRPYIETCIDAFGPGRCMFESNFPVEAGAGSYAILWNAFKRLAAGYSRDEKLALFGGTARETYRLLL